MTPDEPLFLSLPNFSKDYRQAFVSNNSYVSFKIHFQHLPFLGKNHHKVKVGWHSRNFSALWLDGFIQLELSCDYEVC